MAGMLRRVRLPFAFVALALLAAACGGAGEAGEATSSPASKLHGKQFPQPMPTPEKPLRDLEGKRFDFGKRLDGKITLMYFGYTRCPDICPTTMADLAVATRDLSESERREVQVVMVTSDPERDKPKHFRNWLDQFDPSFVGVTGPIDDIIADARQVGVGVSKPKDTHGDYEVTHGVQVIVFYPDAKAHMWYPKGFSAKDVTADLKTLTARG